MSGPSPTFTWVCLCAYFVFAIPGMSGTAQAPSSKNSELATTEKPRTRGWVIPRTPWGHPDLQGIWNNGTATPLERPDDLRDKAVLSEQEWNARATEAATRAERRPGDVNADLALAYNNVWWDRGAPLRRTSLIVDPPDGKLPPLAPEGKRVLAARDAAASRRGPADSWEDRPLPERCLLYHAVPPLPTGYNNNYLILQTPQHVTIRHEMLPETRVIWLDGRPHLRPDVRQWLGNSRGRWENDTLVVETTNYSEKTHLRFFPIDYQTLRVTERFTRTSADAIDYTFTVDNPTMYSRAWTAALPFNRAPGPLHEYACHEANYSIANVLRGHRVQESLQEEGATGKSR
jgi:hypothetical protein